MLNRFSPVLALGVCALASAASAQCTGTVYGLSPYYNPAAGSGFLAVRAGPSTRAQQVGELFNGDRVSVGESSGPWVHVTGQVSGWAHQRWISIRCGGPSPRPPAPEMTPPPPLSSPPAPPPAVEETPDRAPEAE